MRLALAGGRRFLRSRGLDHIDKIFLAQKLSIAAFDEREPGVVSLGIFYVVAETRISRCKLGFESAADRVDKIVCVYRIAVREFRVLPKMKNVLGTAFLHLPAFGDAGNRLERH